MRGGVLCGIDGGGSKTLVAVADASGQVLELRRGTATSPLERQNWPELLATQVHDAARRPGLKAAVAALPAYGEVAEISAAQERVIAELFAHAPTRVLNDVDAAHLGGFGGGPGILILAGTGSMAWARDAAGVSHRTGGWGEIIGDEGSGYWIGRKVLGAISKALDGRGPETGMVAAVFRLAGLDPANGVGQIEGWLAHLDEPRTQIAALARVALQFAEDGDMPARAIVESAADELAWHVRTLERRLAAPAMAWSYAGGLFQAPVLRDAVTERIGRPPRLPLLPPVGGALLAAAQHAGLPGTEEFVARLAASLATAPIEIQE